MVQISILNGIYADSGPDLRTSYPVNMIPVPKQNGVSGGFLRPADGLSLMALVPVRIEVGLTGTAFVTV